MAHLSLRSRALNNFVHLRWRISSILSRVLGRAGLLAGKQPERFVIVKGGYGLGNRLLCLASALIYSRATNRTLVVDWDEGFYGDEGKDSFSSLFRLENCRSINEIPKNATIAPQAWQSRIGDNFYHLAHEVQMPVGERSRKLSCDMKKHNYHHDAVVICLSNFSDGCLGKVRKISRESRDEAIREEFRKHLHPCDDIQNAVDQFVDKHFAGITIGVHIRYTDNMYSTNVQKQGVDLQKTHTTLTNLLKQHPNARVFLATDNQAVLNDYQEEFTTILYVDKWFPETVAAPIHKESVSREDSYQIAKDAVTEMYLLARCNYFIFDSKSTFAQVSCLLQEGGQSHFFPVDQV